ncbi:MAG: carbon-nitrogen hydrolase family protein [Thermodesulfobacteriota bacterium]|nr:carbon-nitrogen hydrolase family protein [Thermodesulfobacteriota bacterium]
MRVTVCELPNDFAVFNNAWDQLVHHIGKHRSEVVVLPEMPFFHWLAHKKEANAHQWEQAVKAHDEWITRLHVLAPAIVISTMPVINDGRRENIGYIWEPDNGIKVAHTKYYLPDEPGFWEASWYQRGDGKFSAAKTSKGKVGFLICTELWFNSHAREYGKQGIHLLVCPRATPSSSVKKWVFGGQTAAVVSGAFCLSSNLAGTTSAGGDFAGVGWIIEPEEGKILGLTSPKQPFLTIDVDLNEAEKAKKTYPRYVSD